LDNSTISLKQTAVPNAEGKTRVVILILTYNGRNYLEECLSSVVSAAVDNLDVIIVVFDNASTDDTASFVRSRFPMVAVLESERNLGFAGGYSRAWEEVDAIYEGIDYIYLLNQDTVVDPLYVTNAVKYLDGHPSAAAAQSLLLLHPETTLINTAGNQIHFLGFGLPGHYRESRDIPLESGVIGYASGASSLLRADYLRANGLFTAELFMYLEDTELGLAMHLQGSPPHFCCESVVYHKYTFASTVRCYKYLERNRWWLLFVFYRYRTLALLLPAFVVMEIGQCIYALKSGLLIQKLTAISSFLNPAFLKITRRRRAQIQAGRKVGDRKLLEAMIGAINSPHVDNFLLRHVGNPFLGLYFRLVKQIVRW
jgi:GT2 family glycosyltransferase